MRIPGRKVRVAAGALVVLAGALSVGAGAAAPAQDAGGGAGTRTLSLPAPDGSGTVGRVRIRADLLYRDGEGNLKRQSMINTGGGRSAGTRLSQAARRVTERLRRELGAAVADGDTARIAVIKNRLRSGRYFNDVLDGDGGPNFGKLGENYVVDAGANVIGVETPGPDSVPPESAGLEREARESTSPPPAVTGVGGEDIASGPGSDGTIADGDLSADGGSDLPPADPRLSDPGTSVDGSPVEDPAVGDVPSGSGASSGASQGELLGNLPLSKLPEMSRAARRRQKEQSTKADHYSSPIPGVDEILGIDDEINQAASNVIGLADFLLFSEDGSTIEKYAAPLMGTCWSCEFVGSFMQIGDAFSRVVYAFLAGHLGSLFIIMFAVWFVAQTSKLFIPDFVESRDSPMGVVRTLAIRSFIFFFVSMLAIGSIDANGDPRAPDTAGMAFQWGPRTALLEMSRAGNALLEEFGVVEGDETQTGDSTGSGDVCGSFEGISEDPLYWEPGQGSGPVGSNLPPLRRDHIREVTCQMESMQMFAGAGILAGLVSLDNASITSGGLGEIVKAVISFVIALFVYGVLMTAFPFYFVDILFQIFFLQAFASLLLMMTLFGPTRPNFFNAVRTVLGSVVTIFTFSVVFAFGKTMLDGTSNLVSRMGAGGGKPKEISGGFVEFIMTADAGNLAVAGQNVAFNFTLSAFWYVVASGILVLMLLRKIAQIVSDIVGGAGNTSMGQGAQSMARTLMGGTVQMAAGGLMFGAVRAAGPAARGASGAMSGGGAAVSRLGSSASNYVRQMMAFRGGGGSSA